MITARTLVSRVSFPRRVQALVPGAEINPERLAFLARELRFVLEIGPFAVANNNPPNLADTSVEIKYANKPVTGGYVPLATLSQPRRMYTEFITWNPAYYDPVNQPQNPTDLQWWRQVSRVTYRLPVPLLLLPSTAELAIRVTYDDLANAWGGAIDTNATPFTLTTEVVGEELPALAKIPATAEIPYIAAYRKHLTGVPPESFQSSRSDLTNGTRANLRLHGFTGVIAGDTSSVYYGKTYAAMRATGQSVNDVQAQILDWKGRTITRSIAPFVDMISRVSRRWPARAEVPPNAFFRILGTVPSTVQAPGQAALLVVGMHGTRTEKL